MEEPSLPQTTILTSQPKTSINYLQSCAVISLPQTTILAAVIYLQAKAGVEDPKGNLLLGLKE